MKKITLVTASMNRNDSLVKSINNNSQLNNVEETIIIDWSSEEKIIKRFPKNKNFKIYRVDNEIDWWLTRAYNFGFSFVKTDYILKLDAESILDKSKFNSQDIEKFDLIIFFQNTKEYDVGNFLVKTDVIKKINGFNEYIFGWGWDDHDLLNRVYKIVPESRVLKLHSSLIKIPHQDSQRIKFNTSKKISNNKNYSYAVRKAFNQTNSYISSLNLWDTGKHKEYDRKQNIINHFYTVKNLDNKTKLFHKLNFAKTFFSILIPKKSIFKRILPLLFVLLNENLIFKLIGINIYPHNKNKE